MSTQQALLQGDYTIAEARVLTEHHAAGKPNGATLDLWRATYREPLTDNTYTAWGRSEHRAIVKLLNKIPWVVPEASNG